MSEMIERVARAMCLDLGVNPDDWDGDDDGNRVYRWQLEAGTARAAIAEMREPTALMKSSMDDALTHADAFIFQSEPAYMHVWNAAIDKALEETK